MECCICGRFFSTSISLGMHILREHSGGICLPDVDFNFDPDFICAITNVPGEENCDLDHLAIKRPRSSSILDEDCSFDDDPGIDKRSFQQEMKMEYDSSHEDEDEDEDDIEDDIEIDSEDHDININDGENSVESNEINGNQPAVIGPDILEKLMEDYYSEKETKTEIPIEMEAAIELLSMLRQSNASLSLYNKIVNWMEQYYIEKKNVGKPPSWEAVNNFWPAGIVWNVSSLINSNAGCLQII